jgi:hypothetical protein
MTMRIGGADGTGWGRHIARVHLQTDATRLAADVAAGADARVIAADKAAVMESRKDVAYPRRTTLVDVTV